MRKILKANINVTDQRLKINYSRSMKGVKVTKNDTFHLEKIQGVCCEV